MKKEFESGFVRPAPEEGAEITADVQESRAVKREKMDLNNLTPEELDQMIIDNLDVQVSEAILSPRGYLDRLKELKAGDFSEAKNWQELYAMIIVKGGVTTSDGKQQTAREVINIIDDFRNGIKLLSGVTRTGGLRDKIRDLWLEEHDKVTGVSAEAK